MIGFLTILEFTSYVLGIAVSILAIYGVFKNKKNLEKNSHLELQQADTPEDNSIEIEKSELITNTTTKHYKKFWTYGSVILIISFSLMITNIIFMGHIQFPSLLSIGMIILSCINFLVIFPYFYNFLQTHYSKEQEHYKIWNKNQKVIFIILSAFIILGLILSIILTVTVSHVFHYLIFIFIALLSLPMIASSGYKRFITYFRVVILYAWLISPMFTFINIITSSI